MLLVSLANALQKLSSYPCSSHSLLKIINSEPLFTHFIESWFCGRNLGQEFKLLGLYAHMLSRCLHSEGDQHFSHFTWDLI